MEKERNKVKELQENLNREIFNVKNLKDMLDVERESSKFATKTAVEQLEVRLFKYEQKQCLKFCLES